MLFRITLLLLVAAMLGGRPAAAQQVTKQSVPGVTNFAKLETTVACGGATAPEAVPEPKKMGFASLINLRLPAGAGGNVEGEAHFLQLGHRFWGRRAAARDGRRSVSRHGDRREERAGLHPLRRRQP